VPHIEAPFAHQGLILLCPTHERMKNAQGAMMAMWPMLECLPHEAPRYPNHQRQVSQGFPI